MADVPLHEYVIQVALNLPNPAFSSPNVEDYCEKAEGEEEE